MKKVIFEGTATEDIVYWTQTNLKTLKKIIQLIENIDKTPFTGLGKPEALKYDLNGFWSRRINETDRLVYKVTKTKIIIATCRYHYKK